ncbi:hypothetical protein [Sphingomonas sp. KR3-1]|uniref:hypothetical protein n=1 Tax=Sphingomonas sp. KR3-1 TaxID=3156611 RepID=UPI0032B60858
MRTALAVSLCLLPMPVLAQSAPAPAPIAVIPAENLALARQLAQVTNSEAMTAAQVTRMIREALPPIFASDPDMQALEKQYPGITKRLLDAAEPMLREESMRSLPKLWDRLAALYAARMTPAELREVIAFYSGGIKERMMAAATNGALDTTGLIKEAMASPEGTISKDSVMSTVTRGAKDVVANLSPADRAALVRFGATPAGRHYNALMPEAVTIATAWANEPSPETDAKLMKLMTGMIEQAGKESSK